MRPRGNISLRLKKIRLLILDADGVLTDGRIMYDESGREISSFDIKDGQGIVLLRRTGVAVALLSGRTSGMMRKRARDLGISPVVQGAIDKVPAYEDIVGRMGVEENEVCYMGDDVLDLPVMKRAGVAVAPRDAMGEVLRAAHIVTRKNGGRGAVREICDAIRRAKER